MYSFDNSRIDFLRHRRLWVAVSILLLIAGVASLLIKGGPRYGIEFTGGAMMQAVIDQPPQMDKLRAGLARLAPGATVIGAQAGDRPSLLITAPVRDGEDLTGVRARLVQALNESGASYQVHSFEAVEAQVGAELRRQALIATGVASAGMLAYIAWRFEFIYGFAAVVAVIHDVVATVGIFSILNQQVTLNVVAALLTLVGYSMNDTIVVFDRVRENRLAMVGKSIEKILNASINQTLRRTLLTSGLTLVAVLALLFFGARVLRGFAFALTLGIIIGTYSSVFVASPIVLWARQRRERRTA